MESFEDIDRPRLTINDYDRLPSIIKGIAIDLRLVVDQLDKDFKKAKDLIIEIARRLDEEKFCERDCICRKLKEILRDKIQDGKISEKWIEDCLPKEYKRKYSSKSEVSSLSKQNKDVAVDVKGNTILTTIDAPDDDYSPKHGATLQASKLVNGNEQIHSSNESKYDSLINQNIELEEVVQRLTTLETADKLFKEEIDFTISRENYGQVDTAMQKSKHAIHLIFDKSGFLIRAEPDV